MKIKIVKETGCFMYLDENNNMIDYFFLNMYRFDQLPNELLEALKTRLEMEKVIPLGIYNNFFDNSLYLVCKNKKFVNEDYAFTFKYSPEGNEKALGYDFYNKYINNTNKSFFSLHDFRDRITAKKD